MIEAVSIVSIPVSDQDAARRFYTEILGFELVRDNPMGPGQRWVQVAPPGARTSFTLVTWFESMPPGCISGIVLETPNLEEERRRLAAAGLSTSAVQSAPWGTFVTFEDLDGNGFVLQQSA